MSNTTLQASTIVKDGVADKDGQLTVRNIYL